MIDLTPKEEKKKIKTDFYLRLVIVFNLTLAISAWFGVVFLTPSYVSLKLAYGNINSQIQQQQNLPVPALDLETSTIIQDVNNKITLIENSEKENFLVSEKVINQILLRKAPEIKITKISYGTTATQKTIEVYGTAPSREALLQFRRALQENTNFKSVDLPISNFIKGSNISFFISLTPA